MYNNAQQPLFPRSSAGASSSDSRSPPQPIFAQMSSGASSSNNSIPPPPAQMLALGDAPDRKRRRLTAKTSIEQLALRARIGVPPRAADPPAGPRVKVLESSSLKSLFQIVMTDFPDGSLGLAPLALSAGQLKMILEQRIGEGQPFQLKVEIGWEARKPIDVESSEIFKYYMSFTAFKVPPFSAVAVGEAYSFPIMPLMQSIRQRALDKLEFATSRGSALEFLRIYEIKFLIVPMTRTLRADGFTDDDVAAALAATGGCSVKLPPSLINKGACLNIANTDDFCFRYALIAWALPEPSYNSNANRPGQYITNATVGKKPKNFVPVFKDVGIDFSMLVYPVSIDSITDFENENKIGIYVFGWKDFSTERGYALQLRRPEQIFPREVQLLLYKGHYLLIKNFQAFFNLRSFKVRSNGKLCYRCLSSLHGAGKLEAHLRKACCLRDEAPIEPPRLPVGAVGRIPKLYFKQQGDIFDHPLVVYADFETFQDKVFGETRGSHTTVLARMNGVASYGYHAVSSIPSIPSGSTITRGTADEFIKEMLVLALRYRHFCFNPANMIITKEQTKAHDAADRCYLCFTPHRVFIELEKKKYLETCEARERTPDIDKKFTYNFVRDHDHTTGLFRGSACSSCNVKAQMPREMIVFFHNMEGFDGHELIQAIIRMRALPSASTTNDNDSDSDDEPLQDEPEHHNAMLEDNYETGDITIDWKRVSKMRFNILANSSEKYMHINLGPVCFATPSSLSIQGLLP